VGAGAAIVLLCYVLAAVARAATRRGRLDGAADPRGAALALAVVVVFNLVTQPVQMWVSRRAEAAADYAALQLTADPDTYLATKEELARANLSDPAPPRWTYVLWSSHPSTVERLTMGERWPFEE
jgi:STE24 endopeptidase